MNLNLSPDGLIEKKEGRLFLANIYKGGFSGCPVFSSPANKYPVCSLGIHMPIFQFC